MHTGGIESQSNGEQLSMKGLTLLLALLALAACGSCAEVGARGPPTPRTLIRDVAITLPPGEAALWGASLGALSSGNVRLNAHNTGATAVDILLLPLKEWMQWQACSADIRGEGTLVRVGAGASAELAGSGGCRQRWVLGVSHAEGSGGWPKAGNATVQLSVVGASSARADS